MNSKEAVDKLAAPDNKLACPNCGSEYVMKVQKKGISIIRKVIIWIFCLVIEAIPNKDLTMMADKSECTCLNCGHKWKT